MADEPLAVPSVDPFASVLRQVLMLPAADQRRLAALLARLTVAQSTPEGSAEDAVTDAAIEPAQPGQAAAGIAAWLQTIEAQAAWTRLQLIEEALEDAASGEERAALHAAMAGLLEAQPALSVRKTIVALASERPVGVLLGLAGLVLALLALLRAVGHALF
ncbi:MAG: hypothetical protein JWQ76_2562 [Ramlibacter sp.]|nr:hypothetical protein [Ramlibacter sp.]